MSPAGGTAPRRLVYLGTPEMAVPPLLALVREGFEVVGVVTRADTRRGRGGVMSPSPVKRAALDAGIPVFHEVEAVLDLDADLGVVVAFGRLVRPPVLAALEMVNVHFSLLPRWRGAAPVERALLAGDTRTGVCLMRLDEGLDTGPVYACSEIDITPAHTGVTLRADLVTIGTDLLLHHLRDGLGEAHAQVGAPTYAAKITPADLVLDWTRPAAERSRVVRLGGAHTTWRGQRLKVHEAEMVDADAVGDELVGDVVGGLRLSVVQPESRAPMRFADFARGARLEPGERLGR